jgi:tetratricopeptide (TPR) repeat protein
VRKYDQQGYPKGPGFGALKTIAVSKNPEKLLVETEKIVAKDPKGLKYNHRVAQLLSDMGHKEAAMAVLEFTARYGDVKGDSKNAPQVFKLLAQVYSDNGRVDEANKALARATKLAPNDKSLKELQKQLSAKSYHDKFKSVKSSHDLVRNKDEAQKLEAKRRAGPQTAEGAAAIIAEAEEALKANPLDRRAIRQIGEALAGVKKYREANKRLLDFLKVDASATEIGEIAADYMNKYFMHEKQKYVKHAQQHPEKKAACEAKIRELDEQKKKFNLQEFARQVESAPTDLEKRYRFGKALFETGDHANAFKQFQKAVKSPKYAKHAGLMMGQCLITLERIEMAEMAFQKVEEQLGEGDDDLRKDLMYFEGELAQKKGETAKALDIFRNLYMEDMEFRDVEEKIEKLKGGEAA